MMMMMMMADAWKSDFILCSSCGVTLLIVLVMSRPWLPRDAGGIGSDTGNVQGTLWQHTKVRMVNKHLFR